MRNIISIALIASLAFISADSYSAGKYKSSSFSNRSNSSFSSKPATKWTSSSSNANKQSGSSAYQQKQQQEQARKAYEERQRLIAEQRARQARAEAEALARQRNTKASTSSSAYSYGSQNTNKSSGTYSYGSQNTGKQDYRPQNSNTTVHNTTIIQDRSSGLTDVLIGAAVVSALTNNDSHAQPVNVNVNAQPQSNQQLATTAPSPTVANPQVASVPEVAPQSRDSLPTITMCTGPQNQHYHEYGTKLASIATKYNIQLVPTAGSMENIAGLGSKCDIAIVQRDAIAKQPPHGQRVSSPYADVAMLMCHNDSKIVKFSQITADTKIATPNPLSGSSITFDALFAGKKYTAIQSSSLPDQLLKLRTKQVDCAFTVGTPTSPAFQVIKPNTIAAIDLSTDQLQNTKDVTGTPIYFNHTLDSSSKFPIHSYRTLFGYRVAELTPDTIAVPNDVVISQKISDNNSILLTDLLTDIDSLK